VARIDVPAWQASTPAHRAPVELLSAPHASHACDNAPTAPRAQDNTIADRPMVELLAALQQMLGEARARAGTAGPGGGALQQLVLILADGRFHEKEALRRAVQARARAQIGSG